MIKISGVTAVVGNLSDDAAFTDDKLREWAWRRKQFTLQKLMESAELNDEASELLAAQQEAQRAAGATAAQGKQRRNTILSRAPVSAEKKAADEKRRAEKKEKKKKAFGSKLLAQNSFLSKILDNLHIQLEKIHVRRPHAPAPSPATLAPLAFHVLTRMQLTTHAHSSHAQLTTRVLWLLPRSCASRAHRDDRTPWV